MTASHPITSEMHDLATKWGMTDDQRCLFFANPEIPDAFNEEWLSQQDECRRADFLVRAFYKAMKIVARDIMLKTNIRDSTIREWLGPHNAPLPSPLIVPVCQAIGMTPHQISRVLQHAALPGAGENELDNCPEKFRPGNLLKAYRERAGVTCKTLGEMCRVQTSMVTDWMRGTQKINPAQVPNIQRALFLTDEEGLRLLDLLLPNMQPVHDTKSQPKPSTCAWLRARRELKRITQEKLAEEAGVPCEALDAFELRAFKRVGALMPPASLEKIMAALELTEQQREAVRALMPPAREWGINPDQQQQTIFQPPGVTRLSHLQPLFRHQRSENKGDNLTR